MAPAGPNPRPAPDVRQPRQDPPTSLHRTQRTGTTRSASQLTTGGPAGSASVVRRTAPSLPAMDGGFPTNATPFQAQFDGTGHPVSSNLGPWVQGSGPSHTPT